MVYPKGLKYDVTCSVCHTTFQSGRSDTLTCSSHCAYKRLRSDPVRYAAHVACSKRYRDNNRAKIQARQNTSYHREKARARAQRYYASNQTERAAKIRGNYHALKHAAIDAYGAVCQCCGEHDWRFLTIDHINGDGSAHRKTVGSGAAIYRWLKREGYPSGFQVLCFNCNCGKWAHGECPHTLADKNYASPK